MKTEPIDMLPSDVQAAIRKAELKDQYGYGAFIEDGKQVFVTVDFYPRRKWSIIRDGAVEPLTREVFSRLERLRLT